ncbi:MAG: phosphatase PAP2 family protein [Gaiellaceae bacterium]
MPIFALILIALAAGALIALVASRYPTPVVGEAPADAATVKIETELEKHPWLLRLVRDRLDPATATGLVLTIALGLAIIGGMLIGLLAYLVRSSDTLVDVDRRVGQWGVDNASSWSTEAIQLVTELGGTYVVIVVLVIAAAVEHRRVPNYWVPVFLVTVIVGEVVLVNTIKVLLDRVRPEFNPIAETLGPSFPSGHSASAAAFYAAVALVLARRRSPTTRALIAGAAVAIAVGVACSRVLLGVHWMSDVAAGLAFGWAWFGICAIAFGGRFLVLGAPVEQAAEVAGQQVDASGAGARHTDAKPSAGQAS